MKYIFFIIIFFILLFDNMNIFLFLIISSVIHETGHILSCIIFGYKPEIKISVFGIRLSEYPDKKYLKLIVLISGPFINCLTIIICLLVLNYKFSLNIYTFTHINKANCSADIAKIIKRICSSLRIYYMIGVRKKKQNS